MAITPAAPAARQQIQGYHRGGFRISGSLHVGSVLVMAERTFPWPVQAPEQVTAESLAPIVAAAAAVDLLILGLGPRFQMVAAELRQALKDQGIALEAMDTGAACRTYNLLLAEDRRVAAALIAL